MIHTAIILLQLYQAVHGIKYLVNNDHNLQNNAPNKVYTNSGITSTFIIIIQFPNMFRTSWPS
jgi:hypothetical protein